jgi:hypothetical protein
MVKGPVQWENEQNSEKALDCSSESKKRSLFRTEVSQMQLGVSSYHSRALLVIQLPESLGGGLIDKSVGALSLDGGGGSFEVSVEIEGSVGADGVWEVGDVVSHGR